MLNVKQEIFYALAVAVAYALANLFAALSQFTLDVNKLVFLALLAIGALAAICVCMLAARQAANESWSTGAISLVVNHVSCAIRNKIERIRVDRINAKFQRNYESFDRIVRNAAKQFDNR